MWPFDRRRRGRHELGAAVRGLPSAPVALAAPAPVVPVYDAPVVPASRVELGFRDGTVQRLDAGSEQSLALEQLAAALTRRD